MLRRPGASALHRAHPLTRLAMLAAGAAMAPLSPAPVLLGGAAFCIVLAFVSGFGGAHLKAMLALLAPVGLAMFAVHGLLIERGEASPFGPLTIYPEGLRYAALVFGRIALLLGVSLLFVMTTGPAELARAFDGAGLAPSVSYLLTAPLGMVETAQADARRIRDALQTRGLSARSGFRARARLLAAMAGPLARGLLVEAPARAEALDARGFRAWPTRATLEPMPDSARQVWLRRALMALALAQLAAALFL